MSDDSISILDGSTFLVSSPNGDIEAKPDQPHGLFYENMRHLSKWKLTIKGIPLDVPSTDAGESRQSTDWEAPSFADLRCSYEQRSG